MNPRASSWWGGLDAALRGRSQRGRSLVIAAVLAGMAYGAVMGSYGGEGPPRPLMMLYAAIKVPLLIVATFAFVAPSWFVLHSLLGLREDLAESFRAVAWSQAALSLCLLSFAPLILLWYASSSDYSSAILANGVMFGAASVGGQLALRRAYSSLLKRRPMHRWMLRVWLSAYVFVAIQLGWLLRPFIGDPELPVQFVRPDAWDNAYVIVAKLVLRKFQGVSD